MVLSELGNVSQCFVTKVSIVAWLVVFEKKLLLLCFLVYTCMQVHQNYAEGDSNFDQVNDVQ